MIEQFAASDLAKEQAWRELDRKLRPFVARRLARESDVDDVLQNVFLKIQRGLSALRDDERFGPWVYRVARSAIVDHLRASARHPLAPNDMDGLVVTEGESGTDTDENAEREVAGYALMFVNLLPSPYREALTLTELEGLSQKAAADMLGVSLSAMKSRVQRGRQKLRTALEECCTIALDARRRVVSCEPRPGGKPPEGCCC